MPICQRAQINQIRAKDDGEEMHDVVGDAVVEEEVNLGIDHAVLVDVDAEVDLDQVVSIHWLVVGAGCMAIWPVTVLEPLHSP